MRTCPSDIRKGRDYCPAILPLYACLSTLSCEEVADYSSVVYKTDVDLLHEGTYPCKVENVAYMDECFASPRRGQLHETFETLDGLIRY